MNKHKAPEVKTIYTPFGIIKTLENYSKKNIYKKIIPNKNGFKVKR